MRKKEKKKGFMRWTGGVREQKIITAHDTKWESKLNNKIGTMSLWVVF